MGTLQKLVSWVGSGIRSFAAGPPIRKGVGEQLFARQFQGWGGGYGTGGFPGTWGNRRWEQVQHFKGWVFRAISAIQEDCSSRKPNIAWVFHDDRDSHGNQRKWMDPLRQNRFLKSQHAIEPHEEIEPVPHNHPLHRLFEQPNEWDLGGYEDLISELVMFLKLTGEAYLWAPPSEYGLRSGNNQPYQLWVMPSQWVWPVTDRMGLDYYAVRPMMGPGYYPMPPEEIIPFRQRGPFHKLAGWSQVQAGAEWIDVGESIDRCRFWMMKNQGSSQGALELGPQYGDPDQDELERIYAKFFARTQGEVNYGKPFITPPGSKYVPLKIVPAEMDFVASADQMRDRVLALFGVPKEVIGIQDAGSEIAMYGPLRQFAKFTINPILRMLGRVLTRALASRYDARLRVWYDDAAEDSPEQINKDLAQDAQWGQITSAEYRAIRGRPTFSPEDEAKYSQIGKPPGGAGAGATPAAGGGMPGAPLGMPGAAAKGLAEADVHAATGNGGVAARPFEREAIIERALAPTNGRAKASEVEGGEGRDAAGRQICHDDATGGRATCERTDQPEQVVQPHRPRQPKQPRTRQPRQPKQPTGKQPRREREEVRDQRLEGEKSAPPAVRKSVSFFSTCERTPEGWCGPGEGEGSGSFFAEGRPRRKPVGPELPFPEPEEEKPGATGDDLPPPEPGYSGTDTLGRIWKDGRVTGEEPLGDEAKVPKLDPAGKIDFEGVLGEKPVDITKRISYDLDLLPEGQVFMSQAVNEAVYLSGLDDEVKQRLVAAGLVKVGGVLGPRLTDKGVVALLENRGFPSGVPVPTTRTGVLLAANLYAGLSLDGREVVADSLGFPEGTGDTMSPMQFRTALTEMLERHYNEPIAARIRKAAEVRKKVDSLAGIASRTARKAEELSRELATLDESLAPINAQMDGFRKIPVNDRTEEQRESWRQAGRASLPIMEKMQTIQKERDTLHATEAKKSLTLPDDKATSVRHAEIDPVAVGMYARDAAKEAAGWLDGLVAKGVADEQLPPYAFVRTQDRACHYAEDNRVNVGDGDTGVQIHEMAHGVEVKMPGALDAALAFLRHRCGDEKPQKLKDLFPGSNYSDSEIGRKDRFDLAFDQNGAYYVGKIYKTGERHYATEVISMGVEKFYRDPSGFARKDPEYASLIVGILDGSLRNKEVPA